MGHFFSKLFRRGGGSSGGSDDTHKATASSSSGSQTKKQPQHSTGSILANSKSQSQNSQLRTNNQQAIKTTNENINQPTLSRQSQNSQISSPQPQRYPVNESNETSPTSRPHIVYRSAPVQQLQQTESPSPVSGKQEVEDAVIKIQALVRGHLTRKALKDGSTVSSTPLLGERQFDERSLYNPPSAVFLPSSPFNITSIQSQNRNHHRNSTNQDNRLLETTTTDTGTAIDGNINQNDEHQAEFVSIVNNNINDISYDVNNNHTAENFNTESEGDNQIIPNSSNNINNPEPTEAAQNVSEAPDDDYLMRPDSPTSNSVTTELNISTARSFLNQKQLSIDCAPLQQQQSTPNTPATASASLIINDYLSVNSNDNRRSTSVPIATVLPLPQSVARTESNVTTNPTILETRQQDDELKEEAAAQTNKIRSNNCLNVNTADQDDVDTDLDKDANGTKTTSSERTSRLSAHHLEQRNFTDNTGGESDSPSTPAEVEGAAIKIQSAFRGYRTRKNSPYRSSSARRSPATPSEDIEQQTIPNGYNQHQTLDDLSPSLAELSATDQQEQHLLEPINQDRNGNINVNNISQPVGSNLAHRRLARQRPTENHSSGSAEDQNQRSITSSMIQSISMEDENTCTVIEGRSQITNAKDQSIEEEEYKLEDDNLSREKLNVVSKPNEDIKSYSIDVIQQHNREFDSEKPRAKSLEQYHQQWPSQEQDTDSSALGAALSYNEDTEEEVGQMMTTTTNLTTDDQQLSSALEIGQDANCSDVEANTISRYDNQATETEEQQMSCRGNILPRESINSTTADLSFANEDEDSMMRQVQQMVDDMDTNINTNNDEDCDYAGTQIDADSIHSNEGENVDDDGGIICGPEEQASSDLEGEIQIDEPVMETTQAEGELESVRQITKINSTEASDQVRLEVIAEEDLDEHQQQALIEGQHALEMESDDIEKRDPTGDMSNERRISSPKIVNMSSPSFERRLSDGAFKAEQNQAIDVPSLNVELISSNPQKVDSIVQEATEDGLEKHPTDLLSKLDKLVLGDNDEGERLSCVNSGCSSPVDGSTTYGNGGTDEEDDETGDIVNNDETSGQSSVAPKQSSNGVTTNQEKKAGNKPNQQQQPTNNKNRNKKNKRKGKK